MPSESISMHYLDLMCHLPPELKSRVRCYSFDRRGGVSPPPFDRLNTGDQVGDVKENVEANLRVIKRFTGVETIVFVRQVHGTSLVLADRLPLGAEGDIHIPPEADGILCGRPGPGLVIRHADCQAVVMFDPEKAVVANIHCGWKGSVKGIIPSAIRELASVYGTRPQDIWAGISPSLGPCCGEFRGWKNILPEWMHSFQVRPDHFDFWAISTEQLVDSGVPREQIFCAETCTKCNTNYFSYRRQRITGRLATLIALSG